MDAVGPEGFEALLERVHRAESGPVIATLRRWLGDLDAAEEAMQDAWLAALGAWRVGGMPERPGAWLLTTARRRALDRLRERARAPLELESLPPEASAAAEEPPSDGSDVVPDDQLRLLFTCCAPSLPREVQVALTLRLVAGLTVAEIAHAFLTSEATVAQRIVRAKRHLRETRVAYDVPGAEELARRLPSVLDVISLVFNEGYVASTGPDLLRHDLVDAALRLGRTLALLLPREPEALGLIALLELQASRGPARTDAEGNAVLMEDQDRSRWDRELIDRGLGHLHRALALRAAGPFQVQAAIAACHAEAPTWSATDWRQILALYDTLRDMSASPVVDLNRAVAVSMVDGPGAALPLVEALAETSVLADHHRVDAVRADLLRRLGRLPEAATCYARAAVRAANLRERTYLERRAAACQAAVGTPGAPR